MGGRGELSVFWHSLLVDAHKCKRGGVVCSLKGRFHHLRPPLCACGARSRALISHFILSLPPCVCVSRRRRVCCQSIAVVALDQLFTLFSVELQKKNTNRHSPFFSSSSSTPPRSLAIPFRSFILSRCLGLFNHEARERTTQLFYNRVFVFHYFLALHYSRQHQSSSPTAAAAHRHLNKKSHHLSHSHLLLQSRALSSSDLNVRTPILNRNTRIGSSVG